MEMSEVCAADARTAMSTAVRAYKETLNTNDPADIELLVDEARKDLSEKDAETLRDELIAAWLSWKAEQELLKLLG